MNWYHWDKYRLISAQSPQLRWERCWFTHQVLISYTAPSLKFNVKHPQVQSWKLSTWFTHQQLQSWKLSTWFTHQQRQSWEVSSWIRLQFTTQRISSLSTCVSLSHAFKVSISSANHETSFHCILHFGFVFADIPFLHVFIFTFLGDRHLCWCYTCTSSS